MVPKDYIVRKQYNITRALSVGRQWVPFSYPAPDGYDTIAVYGYANDPKFVDITGFYPDNYIAVNCVTAGTYTIQVNIVCIKKS